LLQEFPTERLHSEGFSQEMFERMITRMFPQLSNQVRYS
jgi:hypothetical protein